MKTTNAKNIYGNLSPSQWREFAYFSANIQHILAIPFGEPHLKGYLELREYIAKQAILDLRNGLSEGTTNEIFKEAINNGASMFISFHYASYRTLPLKILAEGKSVCVLLSEDVYEVYSDYYKALLATGDSRGTFPKLHLQRAEDPKIFFKLRQMVANGVHIFVYGDGTKGALTSPAPQGHQQIKLLNALVSVRSGYLDFAYLLGTPAYLLLDRTKNPAQATQSDSDLFCYKLQTQRNRREFVKKMLTEIYVCFGHVLKDDPYCWESFLYLHRHTIPKSPSFDWQRQNRIVPFTWQQKRHVLDRYTYRVFEIE